MIELSIVIPFYNSQQFIVETLSSIADQLKSNFVSDLVELVLIDDGSTDNSFANAKKYLDSNVKNFLIFKQNNKGVSSARNLGIKHATGKYILFLDSDDLIQPNFIINFVNKVKYTSVHEFYGFDYLIEAKKIKIMNPYKEKMTVSLTKFLELSFLKKINLSVSSLIFQKNIIDSNFIVFQENLNNGEDLVFLFNYLFKSNLLSININTEKNLIYRIREGSATRSFNPKKFKFLNSLLEIRKSTYFPFHLIKFFDNFLIDNFIYVTKSGIKHSKISEIKPHFFEYLALFGNAKIINTFMINHFYDFFNRFVFLKFHKLYFFLYYIYNKLRLLIKSIR